MDISKYFRSVLQADSAPVVICNTEHTVVYMNPASISRYRCDITGKDIRLCHNAESGKKIEAVVQWFKASPQHNSVHTYYSEKENKDVYMIALRDCEGNLMGYYEKHEYRNKDTSALYTME